MIKNPAELGEKLFDRLKKQNDRFEVKLVIMKMLARVIGRHKLMILGFYTYISKYINPHQKEVSDILAVFCEGTHENVPAEEIHPVMDKIIDLYISEQVANNNICIAINAVREICMRNHEALREDQLHHVANFKMRHKSIGTAVKSLINLYRDINPSLLEKAMRGKLEAMNKEAVDQQKRVDDHLEGLDLLREHEGLPEDYDMLANRVLSNDDLKKIKILKMRKLAQKARAKFDISQLDGFEIVDERFQNQEEDADVEEEESEQEEEEKTDSKPENTLVGKKRTTREDEEEREIFMAPITRDEIDELSSDDDDQNPHNFMTGMMLDTCAKTKQQKRIDSIVTREEKQADRKAVADARHNRKGGGTTNEEKLKNKNITMMRPKKLLSMKDKYRTVKEKIKELKTSLGKVKQGKLKVKRGLNTMK